MRQFYISKKGAVVTAIAPATFCAFFGAVAFGLGFAGLFWVGLFFSAVAVLVALVRRVNYTITLFGGLLTVRRGVIFISVRQARLSDIFSVIIVQTPAHAICKTCWLKVNTVGGSFWVAGLSLAAAEEIQAAVKIVEAPQ